MMRKRALILFAVATGVCVGAAAAVSCVGDDPSNGSSGGVDPDASIPEGGGSDAPANVDAATDAGVDVDAAPVCDASPCVVQIAAGGAHSCARMLDGQVRCWGANAFGESGGGTVFVDAGTENVTPSTYATPHVVAGFPSATVIGAGGSYRSDGISCAATTDLKMYCWGIDKSQQLGRGGTAKFGDTVNPVPARPDPVAVNKLLNVIDMSAGIRHACAVFTGGAVACWGGDVNGALGFPPIIDGGAGTTYGIPQTLSTATKFVRVVSRGYHNLALSDTKQVWGWGDNFSGQHGEPSTAYEPVEQIAALNGMYEDIASGRDHSCALDTTGKVWCFGRGTEGQLGRGAASLMDKLPTPATVSFTPGTLVKQISGDHSHTLAVTSDGSVYEWGRLISGQGLPMDTASVILDVPTLINGLPKRATQVAAGFEHSCALLEGGEVWCWGNNRNAELGRGTVGDGIHLTPAKVVF